MADRMQPAARRRLLIDATIHCLQREGAHGATVRKIAAQAGVSPGLVAHHFSGVEELIELSYRDVASQVGTILDQAVAAAGPDPWQRLAAYVTGSFAPPVLDPALLATWVAFWGLTKSSPPIAAVHRAVYRDYRLAVETLLADCGIEPAERRLTAIAVTALVDGLWLELCLDDSVFTAAEAKLIAENWLASLKRGRR